MACAIQLALVPLYRMVKDAGLLGTYTSMVVFYTGLQAPLIYLGGSPNETIPVVVYQFVGQYVSNWGYIFAAVVLATLPMLLLFLLLQRFVIKGFSTGLKG
jgi:raffinose/stachyose/melibiose transport system permease protein